MSRDLLDKSYSPEEVEKRWYAYWEQEKLFAADENTTKSPIPSSFRRPTSPACCTWGMP
jgi:valyl-tRNA synthetase